MQIGKKIRDLRLRRGHLLEGGNGFLSVELLIKPNRRVDEDNGENRHGIHSLSRETGNHAGSDEDPDHQAVELIDQHP